MKTVKINIALLCIFVGLNSYANDDLSFSGFGTLGLVYVDSEHYGYRKDVSYEDGAFDGEFDFKTNSVLGVQLDYQFTPTLNLSYQAVHRSQNSQSFNSLTNMAFLRYKPNASWSIRVGRVGYDLFHLTEYRDIGFAYSWAKTPSEVYGIIGSRSLDGIDISYTKPFDDFTFTVKLATGVSESETAGYNTASQEVIELADIFNITATIESFEWSIKAKHTTLTLDNNISSLNELIGAISQLSQINPLFWPEGPELASGLALEGKSANYNSLSARYNFGNFVAMTEFSHINGDSSLIRTLDNAYVSLSYLWDVHTVYATFGKTKADEFQASDDFLVNVPPSLLPAFQGVLSAVNTSFNFLASRQTSFSLGWRTDLSDVLALKFQFERTKIEENGGTLWRLNDLSAGLPEDTVNTVFINLDFIF